MMCPPDGRHEPREDANADDHCGILCLVKCRFNHLLNVFNEFICTTEETSLCLLTLCLYIFQN